MGNRERDRDVEESQSMEWKAEGLCCFKTLSSLLINAAKQSNFTLVQSDLVSESTTCLSTRVYALFSPHHCVLLLAIQIILRTASLLKRALTVHRVLAFRQG